MAKIDILNLDLSASDVSAESSFSEISFNDSKSFLSRICSLLRLSAADGDGVRLEDLLHSTFLELQSPEFAPISLEWVDVNSTNFAGGDFDLLLESSFIHDLMDSSKSLWHHDSLRFFLLVVASMSLHISSMKSLKYWVDCNILEVIDLSLGESSAVASRKLAFDMAFVVTSKLMRSSDNAFGLGLLTASNVLIAKLMLKLFVSFVATVPSHYPFMPLKFFESVSWPVQDTMTCSGKLHSLLSFSGNFGNDSDSNYCNFKPVSKRQPWTGSFSTLRLMQLEQCIRGERFSRPVGSIDVGRTPCLLEMERYDVACLLREVFRRISAVDPTLLHRELSQKTAWENLPSCYNCKKIFTIFTLSFSSARRHHCRVCSKSVCSACSTPKAWFGERACTKCMDSFDSLCVLSPLWGIAKRPGTPSATETMSTTDLGDEENEGANDALSLFDKQFERGESSELCCSILLSDDLRAWRDE